MPDQAATENQAEQIEREKQECEQALKEVRTALRRIITSHPTTGSPDLIRALMVREESLLMRRRDLQIHPDGQLHRHPLTQLYNEHRHSQ